MKFFSVRSVCFIFLSSLTLVIPAKLLASKDSSDREVRVTYVQGDVRLSRGDSKGLNLKKPWEEAQAGEFVQEGFALATGSDGRAEVEFAGSSVGGVRSHEIAVGGISPHGSTYSGGGHNYGGGHSNAGSYSGSYSSGSHSSGSGSYGGGSSHSSSGSSGGSSSSGSSSGSSSSSSSSPSSSGGGSRGRP